MYIPNVNNDKGKQGHVRWATLVPQISPYDTRVIEVNGQTIQQESFPDLLFSSQHLLRDLFRMHPNTQVYIQV